MIKTINKIASATPSITALNQGLEAMQKMNPSDQINNMMERFQQDWKYELDRAISAFKEISRVEDYELEDDIEDEDGDEPNPRLIIKMNKGID